MRCTRPRRRNSLRSLQPSAFTPGASIACDPGFLLPPVAYPASRLTRDRASRSASRSARRPNVARRKPALGRTRARLGSNNATWWPPLRLAVKHHASARSQARSTRRPLATRSPQCCLSPATRRPADADRLSRPRAETPENAPEAAHTGVGYSGAPRLRGHQPRAKP